MYLGLILFFQEGCLLCPSPGHLCFLDPLPPYWAKTLTPHLAQMCWLHCVSFQGTWLLNCGWARHNVPRGAGGPTS